jgi:flagellar biosynthesis/type III secretory pathway chaperone
LSAYLLLRLEALGGDADGSSTRKPPTAGISCPASRRKGGGNVDYQHLSTLLWREQELLDLLLFKAEEKQYLILTGKTRWLARIAHEIEVVLDQLRSLEVERAAATEVLSGRLGLESNPSLRQLADVAPAPWNDLLGKHHEALLVLVTDLRSLSDTNRELIEGGLAAIGDALISARTPSAGTYSASGRNDGTTHRAVTLDGAL